MWLDFRVPLVPLRRGFNVFIKVPSETTTPLQPRDTGLHPLGDSIDPEAFLSLEGTGFSRAHPIWESLTVVWRELGGGKLPAIGTDEHSPG